MEEAVEEAEASVTAEAKVVPWVVVREVVQWAVRVVVREVEASVTAEAKAVPWVVVREVVQWAVRVVVRGVVL